MSIEKHISELLFEHDCVIVPDFGGFVCNISSASIHPTKHQFQPPFKKITFNRNLRNNDGLLANWISQAESVSYTESNKLIATYVERIKNELNSNKHFLLNNIGSFYTGEENTLLFEQDETVNYLPESFGLSVFNTPAIKREPIERKIEKKLIDKVIVPFREQGAVVPARKRVSRALLASAAVLVIAVLLWIPFQSGLVKNMDYSSLNPFASKAMALYQPSEDAQPDPDNDITKTEVKDLIAMAVAKDTMRYLNIVIDGRIPIVVKLKADETAVVKAKRRDSKTRGSYHIVGGAFAVSENAEKLVKKLVKQGYDASIIDKKGNSLRFVSYGTFSTKAQALQALEKIRAVQQDVWLMTN